MLKRTILFAAVFLICLTASSTALELTGPKKVRPYEGADLEITSQVPGILTVSVDYFGGVPGRVLLCEPVFAGTTQVSWDGLWENGECPIRDTGAVVRAVLVCDDGTEDTAALNVTFTNPCAVVAFATPWQEAFYPEDGALGIDYFCTFDNMSVTVDIAAADEPDEVLHTVTVQAMSGPQVFHWNAKTQTGSRFAPGDYVLTFYTRPYPEHFAQVRVTILDAPEEPPAQALTRYWQPTGEESPDEIWEMLQEPVTVARGEDGNGMKVYNLPSQNSGVVGNVHCSLAGVRVLEEPAGGFVRVGFYTVEKARYAEGYLPSQNLLTVRPSPLYGLVLDKRTQELKVYYRGEYLGMLKVSTGLRQVKATECLTRAGIYLTGDLMDDFFRDGFWYDYPIRIDGPNLLHSAGLKRAEGGFTDFSEQIAELGTRASHGCVRVDPRRDAETGLNMYYLYSHLARNTKIFVIDSEEEHQAARPQP